MRSSPTVIVGSGMAAYTLAREFRKLDPDAPLAIVTADDGAVYSKPMLSNALAQRKEPEALVQKDAERAAAELNLAILSHTRVTRIDRARKRIEAVRNGVGERIAYGRLVLATGATPRRYRVDGVTAARVATVNSLADYRSWRGDLKDGDAVLLIGAGLIGVEFANDLAIAGHRVTVLDPAPRPLGRLLPEALGALLGEALTAAGIEVITGRAATALGRDGGRGFAALDDGRRIAFDRALSAIGLVPNTDLAEAAGLAVDRGILVDRFLRTGDPDIHALGDCAQTAAGVLPFVLPLMSAARALARTLAGDPTPLCLPALPVAVKTPALPVVVCPPQPGSAGAWTVEGEGMDRRALFAGADGAPLGFALTGARTRERQALAGEMPDLIAA